MEAGKLRHRVELQKKGYAQNTSTGATSVTWSKVANIWADINPLSAREAMNAEALQSKISGKITIRYRSDIDATMRFVYRGKYYNIVGVIPDNMSGIEHITLPYTEGANDV